MHVLARLRQNKLAIGGGTLALFAAATVAFALEPCAMTAFAMPASAMTAPMRDSADRLPAANPAHPHAAMAAMGANDAVPDQAPAHERCPHCQWNAADHCAGLAHVGMAVAASTTRSSAMPVFASGAPPGLASAAPPEQLAIPPPQSRGRRDRRSLAAAEAAAALPVCIRYGVLLI